MRESLIVPVKQNRHLPALSENTFIRYFNFIILYISQGIPEGMCFFGIPAWMAMNGKTPGEIGSFVAMVGLPWSFKIIVAPLMDRFTYLPMGRRRPWVLFGQLGLIASIIAMAFVPDPLHNLSLFMAAGFAIGFFGAFQDVATDGMAVDVVPIKQQARANGFMWGSKIAGTSFSLALGSWLLNRYGFTVAMLSLAGLVALIMLVPLLLRERPGEKILPWSAGRAAPESQQMQVVSWKAIGSSLYKVFTLPNSLLLAATGFLLLGACNYIDTLLPVFTVQALGWTNEAYSQFYATAGLVGGMGGMLLGGILLDRYGKIRMLNIYLLLLIALTLTLAFLKQYWPQHWFISGFMLLFQLLYVFSTIGMFASAMQCCWKKVSATQFTLYMTIANIGRIAGAKALGPIKENASWQYSILAFAVMIAVAWLVIQFINISTQEKQVAKIEAAELPSFSPALP